MTTSRADIATPNWPLYLSRDEAARYVGVSPNVFDDEVTAGAWPAASRRGIKGGRVTWYRPALDAAAQARETGGESDGGTFEAWRTGFTRRRENGQKTPRGRH